MKTVLILALLCLLASSSFAQFGIGDSVVVAAIAGLNVRSLPSLGSSIVAVEKLRALGVVIGGPTSDPNYTFWQVKWPDVTGWSAGVYLTKVNPVPPPYPVSTRDSTMFTLGVASVHVTHDTVRVAIDSLAIQLPGLKIRRVIGDSIIVIDSR